MDDLIAFLRARPGEDEHPAYGQDLAAKGMMGDPTEPSTQGR